MSGNKHSPSETARRLQSLREDIELAAAAAGRESDELRLIAVSKKQDAEKILDALRSGQCDFGENYLQEALPKIAAVADSDKDAAATIHWHFIGPIQSNKTADIARHFDWVHSIDRDKIAQRLSDQRPVDLAPLNVLVQVNIGSESSKAGVPPEDALALCAFIGNLPRLRLCGLMAIPPAETDPDRQLQHFEALRVLRDRITATGLHLPELSMGMSADYVPAIRAGATLLRIGTAVFGPRQ